MSRSILAVAVFAVTMMGLTLPKASLAQYVPYAGLGYYGWGGYPYAAAVQVGANMQTANAVRQADQRAAVNRIAQTHQQANMALVQNARTNTAWAEQNQQDVNRLRFELARSQPTQLAAQSPRTTTPAAPLPTQPAAAPAPSERTKLVVRWPSIFQDPRFEKPRSELEALTEKIKPIKNGLTQEEYDQLYKLIDQMVGLLKPMQKELNVAEYNLAGEFLNSLVLEARSLVKEKTAP